MTRPLPGAALALMGLAAACTGRAERAAATTSVDSIAQPAALPESLVARGPDSTTVWFTLAREDHDSAGGRCVDRTLEIRRGVARIPVPLLYTEVAPRFIDDSTLGAVLYRGCVPLDRYHVDVRTGQPVPVRAR